MSALPARLTALLRWSEKYTKTDMVYLAESGFWLNSSTIVTYTLSFLLSIAFANLLPKEVYGTYQYLLSFSILVSAFTLTGMNFAVTQAVARGFGETLRAAVRLQLRWSILPVSISISGAAYYALQGNVLIAIGLLIIGVCIPLINTFNTYAGYLNGTKDFRGLFVSNLLLNTAYYPSMLLAILFTPHATILLLVNLGVTAGTTFYLYRKIRHMHHVTGGVDDDALTYGKHLSLTNIPGTIVAQLDNVLVFHFLGAAQLAIYAMATTIPEKLSGLFKFIFFASLPKYATQNHADSVFGMPGKMFRVGLVALAFILLFILFAPLFFHLFFPQYLESIPYTQVYALVIFSVIGYLPTSALVSQTRSGIHIYNVISPIIQITLQVWFILIWGLWGILIAKVLGSLLNVPLAWWLMQKR